jgi:hypothetical protein
MSSNVLRVSSMTTLCLPDSDFIATGIFTRPFFENEVNPNVRYKLLFGDDDIKLLISDTSAATIFTLVDAETSIPLVIDFCHALLLIRPDNDLNSLLILIVSWMLSIESIELVYQVSKIVNCSGVKIILPFLTSLLIGLNNEITASVLNIFIGSEATNILCNDG